MRVEQVNEIVNDLTRVYIGEEDLISEDLNNIVDIGQRVINLSNLDRYVNALIDRIGKVKFVDRTYDMKTPSLMMEGWEYGAILEKIQYEGLPEAEENDTWELENGVSYDTNIFTQPTVSAKFFSKKVTYDIPMSFARKQIESAFTSRGQINSFFSMIENTIDKSMNVKIDSLAMMALNNMIGYSLNNNNGITKVNLLDLYNTKFDKELTAAGCIYDPEFIRFSSYIISLYIERLQRLSKLFNAGQKERFTGKSVLKSIMLSEFASASQVYLQSDTFHDNLVKLPSMDTVPYWQGSGTNYDFMTTSKIDVKINNGTQAGTQVTQTGILAVLFDREAVAVSNLDRRVRTHVNERAEFINNWYKFDCGYFNDPDENFIVFYVAD